MVMYDNEFETKDKIEPQHVQANDFTPNALITQYCG